jgi:hypothetical protein
MINEGGLRNRQRKHFVLPILQTTIYCERRSIKMARYKTIEEATRAWVREWNAIPTEAVRIIFNHEIENGMENYMITEEDEYMHGYPVAWGTMFTFGESLDEEWALNNKEILKECGIVAYYSETLGVVFGIDGGGYDFYESHWIPLYKARGLQWHESE